LNVEGKAAWNDHRRRQAETLAFLNQSAEQPVEHPAPLTAAAAFDQAGQEFGAIMLTRKPHASEVAAWPAETANTLRITGVAAFAASLGKPPVFW
jgi:hypothetical protein